MKAIRKRELVALLTAAAQIMLDNQSLLGQLDAQMGDGDLGITMCKAFPAAATEARSSELTDLGRLLVRCGMKMNSAAPSTMGTLMASGFMAAGKELAGEDTLDAEGFFVFLSAFTDGVAARGKAKRGDRTVLDALIPAVDAAGLAVQQQMPLDEVIRLAATGAAQGVEDTKSLIPLHGKAAVLADRTKGQIDQGALVIQLMLEAFHEAFLAISQADLND